MLAINYKPSQDQSTTSRLKTRPKFQLPAGTNAEWCPLSNLGIQPLEESSPIRLPQSANVASQGTRSTVSMVAAD